MSLEKRINILLRSAWDFFELTFDDTDEVHRTQTMKHAVGYVKDAIVAGHVPGFYRGLADIMEPAYVILDSADEEFNPENQTIDVPENMKEGLLNRFIDAQSLVVQLDVESPLAKLLDKRSRRMHHLQLGTKSKDYWLSTCDSVQTYLDQELKDLTLQ